MKRIINTLAATGLFLSSFTWLGAIPARAVTADELCVYTGLGTGFQDDTSWSGCTELSAGDSIELPASAVSGGDKTINNTNPNFNIKNIVFTGAFTTTANNYIFTGESISLTGDITASTATGTPTHTVGNMIKLGGASSQNFTLGTQNLTLDKLDLGTKGASISGTGVLEVSGVISGSGELASSIAALRLLGVNTFTGAVNVTGGTLIVGNKDALGSTSAGTKIDTGAKLQLNMGTTAITNAEPFTFTGASTSGSAPKILLNQTATTSGQELKSGPYYTLSGAITITDDVKTGNSNNYVGYYIDLKLTGALSGAGKKFTVSEGLDFELNVAGSANTTSTVNKTYRSNPFNANLSDSGTGTAGAFTSLTAPEGVTAGNVTINQYGYLKGKGSVADATINGGTVAPGLSPGCLTATGAVAFTGGFLEIEIAGKTVCTEYDQFIIDTAGTIDLGTSPDQATLKISRTAFVPAVGDKFTIINNKNTDAITGTFNGLDEGDTVKVDGVTYKITYEGGDGNDVVLEVTAADASAPTTTAPTTTVPGTPNTGITPAKIFANLLIVSFVGVAISWVILNSNKKSTAKSKK